MACLHPDSDIPSQLRMLEQIAERFTGRVSVYVMVEERSVAFSRKYAIDGTPAFLLVHEGQITERLLGQVELDALTTFIEQNVSGDVVWDIP